MYEERQYYVYILTNGDLARRVHEHRSKAVPGFTRKYDLTRLVWFEVHGTLESAYQREKRIKEWKRAWKIELIEALNPAWRDLIDMLM